MSIDHPIIKRYYQLAEELNNIGSWEGDPYEDEHAKFHTTKEEDNQISAIEKEMASIEKHPEYKKHKQVLLDQAKRNREKTIKAMRKCSKNQRGQITAFNACVLKHLSE